MRPQYIAVNIKLLALLTTAACRLVGAQDRPTSVIVVRLGADTLSVERFQRGPTRMDGEVVRRLPATVRWRYAADLDARGLPFRMDLTPLAASTPDATRGVRRIALSFDNDSVTIETTRDTVARRRLAAPNGLPLLPEAYGFLELVFSALRRSGRDSMLVTVLAPLGGMQGRLGVTLRGDAALVNIIGGAIRVRVNADGDLVSLDGSGTTLKYVGERVSSADLDRAYASFAAQDAARGPLGIFISGRDTVRATIGNATLWLDYGRPSRRGRDLFAHGVLGDTLWRTGANAATQFRTDRDLELGGRVLPAGLSSLWTHFDGGVAELVVNGQAGQWGTQYDRTRDVMRVPLTRGSVAGEQLETFTMEILPGEPGVGRLGLRWGNAAWWVRFTVR